MLFSEQDFERLARVANPTGGTHTPTPWKAGHSNAAAGLFTIVGNDDRPLACFGKAKDRDLALYFTNVHAGIVMLMRSTAETFQFLANTSAEPATKAMAKQQAEQLTIYADLFCRLGKPDETPCAPK